MRARFFRRRHRDGAGAARATPYLSIAICIACGVGLVALFLPPLRIQVLKLEPWTADWRTAILADRAPRPHPRISIVVINRKALDGYKHTTPTPRDLLANVMRAVDAAGARVIGLDFYFLQATDQDGALWDALRQAKAHIVLGAVDLHSPQFRDYWPAQKRLLTEASRPAGYLALQHEPDDVVRYTAPPIDPGYPESFAVRLAKAALGRPEPLAPFLPSTRIAWLTGSSATVSAFETIAVQTVLQGPEAVGGRLENKIVLVGGDFPFRDRHRTPLNVWQRDDLPGVAIHAHILAQLLDGRRYAELSGLQSNVLVAALASLGLLLGWLPWRTRIDLRSYGLATAALVAIDAALYYWLRLALPFTLALWAWVIGITGGHYGRAVWAWARHRAPRGAQASAADSS
jgi:CHASE2 domain-containing sensor protein